MDGAAPPRPGAVAAAPWDPPWDASLLTKGFGAPLPPGPPRLAFVPPFAAGACCWGASAAPNHCTWGSASLRPAPRISDCPSRPPVGDPESPLNPRAAATTIVPRAMPPGPRTSGTAPGAIPQRGTAGVMRAPAARTRAARLAHITPPARRLAPRAPRSLATSWNARALAVDVLAVDIDYATESMCT